MFRTEIGARNLRNQRRIGIFAVTGVIAHTVGDYSAFFAGCGHNVTARTHTKSEHRPILRVGNEFVIGRGEQGVVFAVLREADFILQMLYSYPYGEVFGLHLHAAGIQSFKSVARAVPNGKHHRRNGDNFFLVLCICRYHVRVECFDYRRNNSTIFDVDIIQAGTEFYFAALRNDIFAHRFDDGFQFVAADMRLCEP